MSSYSKWSLLDKYYAAKKPYYCGEKSILTDLEFDALEQSIYAIHGEETLHFDGQGGKWACVGYDTEKHTVIKKNLAIANKKFYIKYGYEQPDSMKNVDENEEYGE